MKRTLPLLLLAATACIDPSGPVPVAPDADGLFAAAKVDKTTSRLFQTYVALGSSIAGGFISGGISGTTQLQAYPVLLAEAAGARFRVPLLAEPGCPAPWIAPLTPSGDASCAGRATPFLPPTLNNVAVPGQNVAEALAGGGGEPLASLFLGRRTQVDAAVLARPTFVTVHLGDNDAVRAALTGSLAGLTSVADFANGYQQVVQALLGVPTLQGAVLVGVTDPLLGMPALQPGAFYFAARDAEGRFLGKPVNPNCAPVTLLGQLNPLAQNLVVMSIVADAAVPEINCDPNAYDVFDPPRGAYLVDVVEQAIINQRVAEFNTIIASIAAAHSWAYFDPNVLIAAALVSRTGGRADELRKCQDLAFATTPAQIQAAVLNTCPVTGPTAAPNVFGSLISFDGVHPSPAGHALLAAALARVIDTRYGTSLGGS